MKKSLLRMVGHDLARFRPWPFCPTNRLLGNPAACRGHKTDGVSPVESRSITPQGGRSGSSSLWSTTGFKPRG